MGAGVPGPGEVGLMPNYVYECRTEDCKLKGKTLDFLFEPVNAPPPDCPNCEQPMTKLIQPVGIAFKGSGFHVNDYPQE